MNAARILREARRRAGLSQRQLSAKTGVPQAAIARIERGRTIPRVDTLDKLLEACSEGLYAEARMGVGVDKTLMEREITLTPANRVWRSEEWSKSVHETRMHSRVPDVVRETFRAPPQLGPILEALLRRDVAFVLLGGQAANSRGLGLPTYDVDICYRRDETNISNLVATLQEFHARLRGAPEDLPDVIDERFIKNGLNFTFDTIHGDFDCLGEPAGTNGYQDLIQNATSEEVAGCVVKVAALADIIRMKRAAGRLKDKLHLEYLGALQEVIDAEEERRRHDT